MNRRLFITTALAGPVLAALTWRVQASRFDCARCHDGGWVCENHELRAWEGTSAEPDVCSCGGAGMPCPDCNELSISMPQAYPLGGRLLL